jgi:two-component system KDP operon response regulator KdpE
VPVIFLTAQADSELATRALRSGADDYVTKLFAPSELMARIEASLRRRVLSDQTEVRAPYKLAALEVNFADRLVTMDGTPVALSATEYKLLLELATNAGRVLTHDQILRQVWGPEYSGESELVRSFIRNLRRKLGDDARNPRYILTEPQVGYRKARPDA